MPSYDIVIIGGGTAGCVLAARLAAAVPDWQILLLEAGPNNNDDANVSTPLTSRRMFGKQEYDWCFQSTPQPGLHGRVIEQTRGRMIGGSSAINSHSLVYPNQEMHDAWAELVGDDEWSWKGMENCYRIFQEELFSEKLYDGHPAKDRLTGEKGPVKASYPVQLSRLQLAWMKAFEELKAVASTDALKGRAIGGTTTTNAIDSRGERSHAGNTYLTTAMRLSNLEVQTASLVEKVVFNKSDSGELHATGVRYTSGAEPLFVQATREVILCAGVFGTPSILERSGIGQHETLLAAGVDSLLDLPGVGENLQDHLNYGPSVEIGSDIPTLDARARDPKLMASQQREYNETRTGVLAQGAAYSFAYWPLQLLNSERDQSTLRDSIEAHRSNVPGAQYIYDALLSPTAASATVFMTSKARYTPTSAPTEENYMSVIAMLSHPLSRGSTHIRSSNPADPPVIDPRYLQDPLDSEILARHVLQIDKFLQLDAFKDIVVPNGRRYPRSSGVVQQQPRIETVAQVQEVIRKHSATNYHPCGTCAMMTREANGVVDGELRVYGTQNLWVCDASIFPIIPRGNILTTVYAVAEKGAEIILRGRR